MNVNDIVHNLKDQIDKMENLVVMVDMFPEDMQQLHFVLRDCGKRPDCMDEHIEYTGFWAECRAGYLALVRDTIPIHPHREIRKSEDTWVKDAHSITIKVIHGVRYIRDTEEDSEDS